jgi:hypothetical protein
MRALVTTLTLLAAGLCFSARAATWPATAAGRESARASFASFEATLDATDSASEALRRWCADRHLADPPVIKADRLRDMDKPADAEVIKALGAAPGEPLRYRRVRLLCGDRVLSEADNWYRPGRLTPEMNAALDATDRPFGVVVGPLAFHRRTLGVDWLFDPLAATGDGGVLTAPHAVLRHRAMLIAGDGAPFSLVVETYTDEVLAPEP